MILQYLANLQGQIPKDGLLLIAFIGHGLERDGKAYLLSTDALGSDPTLLQDTAISVEQINRLAGGTGAGQVMLILDAWRSDPLAGRASTGNPLKVTFTQAFNRVAPTFACLFATSVGERSYERTGQKQGYFIWGVTEALKGKAANEKRESTLDGVIKYLQTTVPSLVQQELGASQQQHPFVLVEGYKRDEVVIAGRPREQSIYFILDTMYLRDAESRELLAEELRKQPEFQSLGFTIVNDEKLADLTIKFTRPFLTFTWPFSIINRQTNKTLAEGKIKGTHHGQDAARRLAPEIAKKLQGLPIPRCD